jgi:hypothetical protein
MLRDYQSNRYPIVKFHIREYIFVPEPLAIDAFVLPFCIFTVIVGETILWRIFGIFLRVANFSKHPQGYGGQGIARVAFSGVE